MEKSTLHNRPPAYNLLSQGLLWDQPLSSFIQYATFILSNIQCVLLLLAYQLLFIAGLNQDSFAYYLTRFCKTLSLIDVVDFEKHEDAIYIILVAGVVYALIFITPFVLSLRNYWINGSFSPRKSAFCIYFGLVHRALGFWIFNAFTMSYLNFGLIDANGETGIAIVCMLLIIINYLMAFYFALFSHDPFIGSNVLSCHSTSFQIYSFYFKGIAAPIIFLVDDSRSVRWAFVVLTLVVLGMRHFDLLRKFPFYNYTSMKLAVVLSTICLWIALANFVAQTNISRYLTYSNVLIYMAVPICSLMLRIMMDGFHRILVNSISRESRHLKSTPEITRKIFAILYLMERTKLTSAEETKKSMNEMRFFGALSATDSQKYLNQVATLIGGGYAKMDINTNGEAMAQILRGVLEDAVERFNKNQQLQILRANSSLNNSFPFEVSMFNMHDLTKLQGGSRLLTVKLYHKLQGKLSGFFEENKDSILDLNKFLEHEAASANLNNAIQNCIKHYINYWQTYLKATLKIKDFFLKSKELERIADNIEGLWKRYADNNRLFAGAFCNVYSVYLSLLRASPYHAQLIYHKYSQIKLEQIFKAERERLFTNETLSSPNTFSIHASLTKESPGKILKLSANFAELTGWTAQDILGHNVNILMPPFMAYSHNKLLLNHLKKLHIGQNSSKMYTTLPSYIMHKSGHLLPCDVYISIHPVVQDTPVYLVFVKIKTGANEQILLSEDGNIEGFTGKIGHLLDLKNKTKSSYSSICANFATVQIALENLKYEYSSQLDNFSNIDAEAGQSIEVDFRLPRQNPLKKNSVTYAVDIIPHVFDKKLYFCFSMAQQQAIAKDGETNIFSMQKFETQKEEESEVMSQIPYEHPDRNPPLISPKSSFKNIQFDFNYKKTEDEPTVFVINNTNQRNLLTSNYYNLNSETNAPGVTSFIVEDGMNALFSSNRGLVPNNNNNFEENLMEEQKQEVKLKDIQLMASSSVGSSSKTTVTKFEKALTAMPANPQIRWLYLTFIGLMIVAGFPLILFQQKVSTVLDQVHGSGEVISNLIFRLTRYTDVYAYAHVLWQATVGLTDLYRYNQYGYTVDTITYNMGVMVEILENVRDTNNGIRDFVYKLDPKLSEQIYSDTVPVTEVQANGTRTSTREANLFDLSTELVATGTKMLNAGITFDDSNPYLAFLVNNTMNEPLLAGERELPILINDNKSKLNGLSTYTYMMIGITFALAVVIGFYFNRIVQKFLRERSQFIFVFSNMDEKHIHDHLALLENFQASFTRTSQSQTTASRGHFLQHAKSTQKNGSSQKKTADTSKISHTIYLLYLITGLFLLAICSVYPIMSVVIKHNSKTILKKLELMAQSNMNFYNVVYYWNVVYAYAQYGMDGYEYVKNKPITTGVKLAAEDVLGVQEFIINDLLNPDNGLSENTLLYNTAVGNLCDIYSFTDEILMNICPTLGDGAATRGILGLHTYHVVGLQAIEQCWTTSDKTWEDSKICLGLEYMINIEVFYPYTYNSYKNIDRLIREEMVKDYDRVNNSIVKFVIIYIVIYARIGTLAGWKIKKRLEEEMTDWRKMIRQIPFIIANESKLMKVFLQRNREDV